LFLFDRIKIIFYTSGRGKYPQRYLSSKKALSKKGRKMEILVLVDYHNVYKLCRKKEINADEVFRIMIETIQKRGRIVEIRLFVPNYQQNIHPWTMINHLKLAYGVAVEICSVLRAGEEDEEKYKDLVDKAVDSWIMKYVHPDTGPELIIFAASDGHFIDSWHEVKRRGKESEFLLLDPETTSWAILKYAPFERLELKKGEEKNPFALVLRKRLEEGIATFDDAEKEKMRVLKKIQKILSSLPQYGLDSETTKNFLIKKVQDGLNMEEKEIRKAIDGLINVRAIRVHPFYSLDPSSPYLQWLEFFEN
jgi:hypothetical protein